MARLNIHGANTPHDLQKYKYSASKPLEWECAFHSLKSTAPTRPFATCSSSGIDLPAGMRGEETLNVVDAAGKSKKHDRAQPAATAGDKQEAAGLRQIEGVVHNLSELRKRSRKAAKDPDVPSPAPAVGEETLARNSSTESGGMKAEGAR